MKKLFALFLTLLLALSLAACDNVDTEERPLAIPAEGEQAEFVPPVGYDSVILVTINPQIRMYLDAQGNVLAVEAVNKDAKKLLETMELENSHYTDAMEQIVSAANEAGYIHSTTVIHVDIDDDKKNPTVDVSEVEEQIQEILAETAPDLKIQVQVKIKQKKPAETEPTEETQPEPTQCAHTWKDATCFLPKTCTSCGETEGEALGHTWKDATCIDPKICIQHTEVGDIIASDGLMAKDDANMNGVRESLILKKALAAFKPEYDFIVLDHNPGHGGILNNVLTATDDIIIPMQTDGFSLDGAADLAERINSVKEFTNHDLRVAGVVLTLYNGRTRTAKQFVAQTEAIEEVFGTKVFETKIRQCQALSDANSARMSIFDYDPRGNGAADYNAMIDEYLKGVN